MSSFLWNLGQDMTRNTGASDAARAQTRVASVADDVERLSKQVERLTLASQAMWEMLRATGSFSEEDLLAKMEEVDLRDGRADGKIGMARLQCPNCRRITNSRRGNCMYCGTEFVRQHVFEGG